MAKDLHVSVSEASYCVTIFILFEGVTPLSLAPFANIYGRRIIYVVSPELVLVQGKHPLLTSL